MSYQLTPLPAPPRNKSFMESFIGGLFSSMMPLLQYKYQKQMEEDAWTKRQQMEQEWEKQKFLLQLERDKNDPTKVNAAAKGVIDLQAAQLGLDEAQAKAEWRKTHPEAFGAKMASDYNYTNTDRLGEKTSGMALDAIKDVESPQSVPPPFVFQRSPQPQTPESDLKQGLYGPRIRGMFGAKETPVRDDTLSRMLGRAALSKGTGIPTEQLESVPQFAPTTGEIAGRERVAVTKRDEKVLDLFATEDAKRNIAIDNAVKDRVEGYGESVPQARAKVLAERAAQSDTPVAQAITKAMADRSAQIALLGADGMPPEQAEALIAKANKEKYLKDLPPSMPEDVRRELGKIAANGIPIPTPPGMGIGASGLPERIAFYRNFIEEVNALGGARQYGLARLDYKTIGSALNKQVPRLASMESFVKNIDKQVARVETDVLPALKRVDSKIANMPLKWWETHVPGNADENILSMYAKEISAEIQRLSAGSADSIATLPEGNRMEWEKVHDTTLPISEIARVFRETSHAGHMRYDTLYDVVQTLREEVGGGYADPMKRPTWKETVNPPRSNSTAPADSGTSVGRFKIEVVQ